MPRGSKHSDEIKERAFALLATGESVAVTAKELRLSYSTVKTWEKSWREASQKLAEPTQPGAHPQTPDGENPPAQSEGESEREPSLNELRTKRKKEFADNAWRIIEDAQKVLERRVSRALHKEDVLDEIVAMVEANEAGFSAEEQKRILNRLSHVRLDDMRALSGVLATLYDKQALAVGEATEIFDDARFENL